VQILKTRVDEEALAAGFADSAYHCEHHNFDLNSVGKYILSELPHENGFKVVLTGEGADEHFAGWSNVFPRPRTSKTNKYARISVLPE
jgi:asparagine synthase (glutamine-hydrolysing)